MSRYKLFIFLARPAVAYQRLLAFILQCEFRTTYVGPTVEYDICNTIDPALREFQNGNISIGRMKEIASAWKNNKAYALPKAPQE